MGVSTKDTNFGIDGALIDTGSNLMSSVRKTFLPVGRGADM